MTRQAKQFLGFVIVVGIFVVFIAMVILADNYGAWVWAIRLRAHDPTWSYLARCCARGSSRGLPSRQFGRLRCHTRARRGQRPPRPWPRYRRCAVHRQQEVGGAQDGCGRRSTNRKSHADLTRQTRTRTHTRSSLSARWPRRKVSRRCPTGTEARSSRAVCRGQAISSADLFPLIAGWWIRLPPILFRYRELGPFYTGLRMGSSQPTLSSHAGSIITGTRSFFWLTQISHPFARGTIALRRFQSHRSARGAPSRAR